MHPIVLTFDEGVRAAESSQFRQQPGTSLKRSYIFCFLLYFLQGNVVSIGLTMPYLYRELPSYKTLALFSTIDLPFSFKFLLSPFLEKYTNLGYGKRKTWIIISQLCCSLTLLMSSHFTEISQAPYLALLLMTSEFFITIQDISLDSLSIKEMRCPEKASMVQSVAQSFGVVIGSLFLLKLTSNQFALKVGFTESITTPYVMIRVIACCLILSAVVLHFTFRETSLACEHKGKQKSIWEIIKYTRTFCKLESRYCRTALFFLIYYQGLKFYEAGYDYELIKAGFSRDTSNSISNLIALPIIFMTFYMGGWIAKLGNRQSLLVCIGSLSLLYSIIIGMFPLSPYVVACSMFASVSLITFKNMVLYIMINSFPIHAVSGMFITILLSVWNLGELKTFNTLIIDVVGWRPAAIVGIVLQILILAALPKILAWIEAGSIEIDASISEADYGEGEERVALNQIDESSPVEGTEITL